MNRLKGLKGCENECGLFSEYEESALIQSWFSAPQYLILHFILHEVATIKKFLTLLLRRRGVQGSLSAIQIKDTKISTDVAREPGNQQLLTRNVVAEG